MREALLSRRSANTSPSRAEWSTLLACPGDVLHEKCVYSGLMLRLVCAGRRQVASQLWLILSFAYDSLAVAAQGLVADRMGSGSVKAARGVAALVRS